MEQYEYGPFGEVVKKTGTASGQPFRFSNKYQDEETGLLYYGYRYLGKHNWLDRDPSEEAGGANLYNLISNNSVNSVDPYGLDRYITQFDILNLGNSKQLGGGTQIHVGVAVNTWECQNGKPVITGIETYDFGLKLTLGNFWYNIIGGIFWKGSGILVPSSGLTLSAPIKLSSTYCQDKKLLKDLQQQVSKPLFYNVIVQNCIWWSAIEITVGMNEKGVGCCCDGK